MIANGLMNLEPLVSTAVPLSQAAQAIIDLRARKGNPIKVQVTPWTRYGINTFLWSSPFQTKDLHYLDHAKALGFDLVEIPIESAGDIDYGAAADAYARTGLACTTCAVMGAGPRPFAPRPEDPAGRHRLPESLH